MSDEKEKMQERLRAFWEQPENRGRLSNEDGTLAFAEAEVRLALPKKCKCQLEAGVVFFMTADDARDLSIQLSKAANVADEIRQPDQPKDPT